MSKLEYAQLQSSRGHLLVGNEPAAAELAREAWTMHLKFLPLINEYLHKTAALAQRNGIKTYWYTYPVNQATCDKLRPDYLQEFQDRLQYLADNYGVTVLNGLECKPDNYFGDPNHVNEYGAEQATRDLLQRIGDT